ncbi:MAG: DUF4837 family protein [Flavobacteriales bacterium]|nr:DUF4837 family protein [Flavobacteriales bacterium]
MNKGAVVFLLILFFWSCEKKEDTFYGLPSAYGNIGELAVISDDSVIIATSTTLESVFQKSIEGLPTHLPIFRLNIKPLSEANNMHLRNYNLCVLFDASKPEVYKDLFGDSVVLSFQKKLKEGKQILLYKDLFATPQNVILVIGNNSSEIKSLLEKHQNQLIDYAKESNRINTRKEIYGGGVNKNLLLDSMLKVYGYGIARPGGYRKSIIETDSFYGFGKYPNEVWQGFYIYSEDFKDSSQLKQSAIISRRNRVLKEKVQQAGNGIDGGVAYMGTDEKNVVVSSSVKTINGLYTVETRGWWEMVNGIMGGPFVSYTYLCPKINKIVTVDCIVFAPDGKFGSYLREAEIIATTFAEKK